VSFKTGNQLTTPKPEYIPWQPGEQLTFVGHYGPINAGEATLEVKKDMKMIANRPHFDVVAKGWSYSTFDPFYKVRDQYETFIDEKTMMPTVFLRDVYENGYQKQEHYIFDRKHSRVKSGNNFYSVPTDVQDLESAFFFLRCVNFEKQAFNSTFPVTAFFNDSIFPMGVKYIGKEVINGKIGKIRCKVFKPILLPGRIFKGQDDMTLYVSDDKNQIPVRVESAVLVGSIRGDLIRYSGLKYPFTALIPD
jgi:hypothetical protein